MKNIEGLNLLQEYVCSKPFCWIGFIYILFLQKQERERIVWSISELGVRREEQSDEVRMCLTLHGVRLCATWSRTLRCLALRTARLVRFMKHKNAKNSRDTASLSGESLQ